MHKTVIFQGLTVDRNVIIPITTKADCHSYSGVYVLIKSFLSKRLA